MIDLPFDEVWAVDFEFMAPPGERPDPVCLCARELKTGRLSVWRNEFGSRPPYRTDAGVLFTAYYASAELGCHRVLGWPMPARILDLFAEFRAATNGLQTVAGNSLLGALAHYGLNSMGAGEKEAMRSLILRAVERARATGDPLLLRSRHRRPGALAAGDAAGD